MKAPLRLGILVSGSGTNLQAILDACSSGKIAAEVALVVCNRPKAKAIERARQAGVGVAVVDHRRFDSREAFEAEVVTALRGAAVDLLCLAGFDRLITPTLIGAFPEKILNIHPALLPAFTGLHAQRQALEYGVRLAGCTVHFVDEKMDHGPIVRQAAVPVYDDDDEASLGARILVEEHRIYAEAIALFAAGRLRIDGRRVRILPAG